MSLVTTQIDSSIGTLTLNHPRKHNALSGQLVGDLIAGFEALQQADVRVVVLRALPGARVWSAGHDVNELPESGRDPLGFDDPLRQLVRTIENLPCPVIAMVEGGVWGGACEVVLACDIVVAAPSGSGWDVRFTGSLADSHQTALTASGAGSCRNKPRTAGPWWYAAVGRWKENCEDPRSVRVAWQGCGCFGLVTQSPAGRY